MLFLAILAAVRPHFKATLQPKFCKNRFRGYTPFGQLYTKNYLFQRFWGL